MKVLGAEHPPGRCYPARRRLDRDPAKDHPNRIHPDGFAWKAAGRVHLAETSSSYRAATLVTAGFAGMSDKRIEPRERAFVPGRIAGPSSGEERWCTVKDLSKTGARLSFIKPQSIPADGFRLEIPSAGKAYEARIMWNRGREIGVAFHPTEESAPSSVP
jgi:hypothetical protein